MAQIFPNTRRSFDLTLQDLRYATRWLTRRPAFAAVAVLTLALGIGGTTAVFSLVDAVLIRPLPIRDPERLLLIDAINRRGERQNLSYPFYERLRDEKRLFETLFEGVFASIDGTNHVEIGGPEPGSQPEPAVMALVSGAYFDVLGVRAIAGRTFTAAEDNRDAAEAAVAVLSHRFWRTRFNGDPGAIGKTLQVRGQVLSIVGITPPGFFGEAVGRAPDFWTPLVMQPVFDRGDTMLAANNIGWLRVFVRVRPNVTEREAQSALELFAAQLQVETQHLTPANRHPARLRISNGSRGVERLREQFAMPLRILAAIVGVVLLISCANVATLLLARATMRQRELAIRAAIGADRRRLIRQLLTESVVFTAIAGAIGVGLGYVGSRVLLVLASNDVLPLPIDVTLDRRMLAFTLVVGLVTVVLFGLAPALTGSRVDSTTALNPTSRGTTPRRLPRILIAVQVALSLMLLTAASLFVQTLANLRARDLGFSESSVVQVRVGTAGYRPAQVPDLSRRILERLSGVPGAESVSALHSGFGGRLSTTCCLAVEGHPNPPDEQRTVRTLGVGPGYFDTMRLPLVLGRDFNPAESSSQGRYISRTVIVNEAFVRQYLGGTSPIGARLGWGDPPKVAYDTEIVGVVRNAIHEDPRRGAAPVIYFSSLAGTWFVVRTSSPPERVMPLLRHEILRVDAKLGVSLSTLSSERERAFVREKLLATLASFFGTLAALLAAIGLYGLMGYSVVLRTKELGIRMALGAGYRTVVLAEVRSAIRLVLNGIALGVPLALGAGRIIKGQLFGVAATDPTTLVTVAGLLVTIALVAAYLPARRAASIDPIAALRWE